MTNTTNEKRKGMAVRILDKHHEAFAKLSKIGIGNGAVSKPADTSRETIDKILRHFLSSTFDSRMVVRIYDGEGPYLDVDIGDLIRDLDAERYTLKVLCVEHLTELDYLREQTRFNSDDRESWRAMADRIRSAIK